MEELIQRISAATGMDAATTTKAVGIILAFLQKEAPAEDVSRMFEAMPGSQELAAAHADDEGGGGLMGAIGGLMGGGGLMALAGKLSGAGLSMDQMQTLGKELFAYGREKAGEDAMGSIVGAVPGLGQFV
ncbi:hypothetical protein SLNSH_23240 [Alsobacter soli]|uniref:DUF2267 domain-containing protein n=1 Tax=Alsobacter soli TaxID=2109933 RepID=A0A2T1HLR8_9HYPH|nr:DUF937 domain-containing protein [Alsobacter soli]PSC02593.1 hypothetical protein SLNSH_23240 [Alsobacter soli]